MQFMASKNQRERMQTWIAESGIDEAAVRDSLIKSLDRSANRFAKWRWQTLREVIAGMMRMRDAMKVVASGPKAAELFSSKEDKSRDLCSAILDSATWDMTEALIVVLRPLTDLSGWIRGCSCHEAELKSGKQIKCPWKGCRGPMIARKLKNTLATMHNNRESFAGNGSVSKADMAFTIGLYMSDLQNKFHWVEEPPYLIWQAPVSVDLCFVVQC